MLVNRTQVRNAWNALEAALGIDTATDATPEAIAEALSHGDTRNALELALRSEHPTPGDGYWLWVRDVYDDMVVYEYTTPNDGTLYRRSYTMSDSGTVTFGVAEEVTAQTVYAPVGAPAATTESIALTSDLVPLIERAVRADNTVPLKVIQPGWGSSGYYSSELLQRDGPKVFTEGLHMYLDHPTDSENSERPERSVKDLAGRLVSDAYWQENGAAGPGLYADAEVFAPFRDVLDEIAPHIGVSIRAAGRISEGERDGRTGRIVEELVQAESVDWVTRAGAGGQVVTIMESARNIQTPTPVAQAIYEGIRNGALRAAATTKEPTMTDQVNDLQEARNEIATLRTELSRLSGLRILDEARSNASALLATVDLPAFAKRRILESVSADPAEKDGVLDKDALKGAVEAQVTAWRTDLAEADTATGAIVGMGATEQLTESQVQEQLSAAFVRLGLPIDAATTR